MPPSSPEEIQAPIRQTIRANGEELIAEQYEYVDNKRHYTTNGRFETISRRMGRTIDAEDRAVRKYYETAMQDAYKAGAEYGLDGIPGERVESYQMTNSDMAIARHQKKRGLQELDQSTAYARRDRRRVINDFKGDKARTQNIHRDTDYPYDKGLKGHRDVGGRKWRLDKYHEMTISARTNSIFNRGSIEATAKRGVKAWEIVDGPDCGLVRHEDGTAANGMIVNAKTAREHLIAHPFCTRRFIPKPGVRPPGGAIDDIIAFAKFNAQVQGAILGANIGRIGLSLYRKSLMHQRFHQTMANGEPLYARFPIALRDLLRDLNIFFFPPNNIIDFRTGLPVRRFALRDLIDHIRSLDDDILSNREIPAYIRSVLGVTQRDVPKVVNGQFQRFSDWVDHTIRANLSIDDLADLLRLDDQGQQALLDFMGPHRFEGKFARVTIPNLGGTGRRPRLAFLPDNEFFRSTITFTRERGFLGNFRINRNGLLRVGFELDSKTKLMYPNLSIIPRGPIRISTKVNRSSGILVDSPAAMERALTFAQKYNLDPAGIVWNKRFGRGVITSISANARIVTKETGRAFQLLHGIDASLNLNLRKLGLRSFKDVWHLSMEDWRKLRLDDLKFISVGSEMRLRGYGVMDFARSFRITPEQARKVWHLANRKAINEFLKKQDHPISQVIALFGGDRVVDPRLLSSYLKQQYSKYLPSRIISQLGEQFDQLAVDTLSIVRSNRPVNDALLLLRDLQIEVLSFINLEPIPLIMREGWNLIEIFLKSTRPIGKVIDADFSRSKTSVIKDYPKKKPPRKIMYREEIPDTKIWGELEAHVPEVPKLDADFYPRDPSPNPVNDLALMERGNFVFFDTMEAAKADGRLSLPAFKMEAKIMEDTAARLTSIFPDAPVLPVTIERDIGEGIYASYFEHRETMVFGTKQFLERMPAAIYRYNYNVSIGYFVPAKAGTHPVVSYMVHEYGHFLLHKAVLSGQIYSMIPIILEIAVLLGDPTFPYSGTREEMIDHIEDHNIRVYGDVDNMVSGYAAETWHELIAEATVEFLLSDNPRPIARLIGEEWIRLYSRSRVGLPPAPAPIALPPAPSLAALATPPPQPPRSHPIMDREDLEQAPDKWEKLGEHTAEISVTRENFEPTGADNEDVVRIDAGNFVIYDVLSHASLANRPAITDFEPERLELVVDAAAKLSAALPNAPKLHITFTDDSAEYSAVFDDVQSFEVVIAEDTMDPLYDEMYQEQMNDGYFVKTGDKNALQTTIVHEYGHFLWDALIQSGRGEKLVDLLGQIFAEDFDPSTQKLATFPHNAHTQDKITFVNDLSKKPPISVIDALGGYAWFNWAEFVAEATVSFFMGETDNKYAQAIGKLWLDEFGEAAGEHALNYLWEQQPLGQIEFGPIQPQGRPMISGGDVANDPERWERLAEHTAEIPRYDRNDEYTFGEPDTPGYIRQNIFSVSRGNVVFIENLQNTIKEGRDHITSHMDILGQLEDAAARISAALPGFENLTVEFANLGFLGADYKRNESRVIFDFDMIRFNQSTQALREFNEESGYFVKTHGAPAMHGTLIHEIGHHLFATMLASGQGDAILDAIQEIAEHLQLEDYPWLGTPQSQIEFVLRDLPFETAAVPRITQELSGYAARNWADLFSEATVDYFLNSQNTSFIGDVVGSLWLKEFGRPDPVWAVIPPLPAYPDPPILPPMDLPPGSWNISFPDDIYESEDRWAFLASDPDLPQRTEQTVPIQNNPVVIIDRGRFRFIDSIMRADAESRLHIIELPKQLERLEDAAARLTVALPDAPNIDVTLAVLTEYMGDYNVFYNLLQTNIVFDWRTLRDDEVAQLVLEMEIESRYRVQIPDQDVLQAMFIREWSMFLLESALLADRHAQVFTVIQEIARRIDDENYPFYAGDLDFHLLYITDPQNQPGPKIVDALSGAAKDSWFDLIAEATVDFFMNKSPTPIGNLMGKLWLDIFGYHPEVTPQPPPSPNIPIDPPNTITELEDAVKLFGGLPSHWVFSVADQLWLWLGRSIGAIPITSQTIDDPVLGYSYLEIKRGVVTITDSETEAEAADRKFIMEYPLQFTSLMNAIGKLSVSLPYAPNLRVQMGEGGEFGTEYDWDNEYLIIDWLLWEHVEAAQALYNVELENKLRVETQDKQIVQVDFMGEYAYHLLKEATKAGHHERIAQAATAIAQELGDTAFPYLVTDEQKVEYVIDHMSKPPVGVETFLSVKAQTDWRELFSEAFVSFFMNDNQGVIANIVGKMWLDIYGVNIEPVDTTPAIPPPPTPPALPPAPEPPPKADIPLKEQLQNPETDRWNLLENYERNIESTWTNMFHLPEMWPMVRRADLPGEMSMEVGNFIFYDSLEQAQDENRWPMSKFIEDMAIAETAAKRISAALPNVPPIRVSIRLEGMGQGTYGEYDLFSGEIYFNGRHLIFSEATDEDNQRHVQSGWFANTGDINWVQTLLVHEYAHYLTVVAANRGHELKVIEAIEKIATYISDEQFPYNGTIQDKYMHVHYTSGRFTGAAKNKITQELSGYAAEDWTELIAEATVEWLMGGTHVGFMGQTIGKLWLDLFGGVE